MIDSLPLFHRIAGQPVIVLGEGDGRREHMLIRADMFTTSDDAAGAFMRKARLLIDQQGEDLFG